MKNTKRIIAILLTIVMVMATFVACSNSTTNDEEVNNSVHSNTVGINETEGENNDDGEDNDDEVNYNDNSENETEKDTNEDVSNNTENPATNEESKNDIEDSVISNETIDNTTVEDSTMDNETIDNTDDEQESEPVTPNTSSERQYLVEEVYETDDYGTEYLVDAILYYYDENGNKCIVEDYDTDGDGINDITAYGKTLEELQQLYEEVYIDDDGWPVVYAGPRKEN